MHNWNWDDLRYVAALADTGTITEAARRLNVNRTTVQRRITAFEQQLKYRLFSRDGWGLTPLPEAAPILEAARQIDESLSAIQRKMNGASGDVAGDLTFTTTNSMFIAQIAELVRRFQDAHPSIQLHINLTSSTLNLNPRGAEVAIQPSTAPPEHLAGRRICDVTFGLYASWDYAARFKSHSPAEHDWIGYTDGLEGTPANSWLANNVPRNRIRMRADNYVAIAEAARWGSGIAVLPRAFGDRHEGLRRIEGLLDERIATGLWMLTHPDLRQSPRVRAFMDFMSDALSDVRSVFDC
ncbi:LysR family transcriptional regulator [Henriciella pelagia]|uniref:LysR family transcriptional regulator n=1 Tax=Henriciella pelagia TaxID=1977912 RepID=A0ABQ1JKR8_9PROT|nr:LysR family transcriptional regulator [Henriciella pelagia]GGB68735.1 LysR family transcriptional regulator [Henriciella pelagia]